MRPTYDTTIPQKGTEILTFDPAIGIHRIHNYAAGVKTKGHRIMFCDKVKEIVKKYQASKDKFKDKEIFAAEIDALMLKYPRDRKAGTPTASK